MTIEWETVTVEEKKLIFDFEPDILFLFDRDTYQYHCLSEIIDHWRLKELDLDDEEYEASASFASDITWSIMEHKAETTKDMKREIPEHVENYIRVLRVL